jgi:hypothetical protein
MCCVDKVYESNTHYKSGQEFLMKFEVYHATKIGDM